MVLLALIFYVCLIGCQRNSVPSASAIYENAKSRFESGDLPGALRVVESGEAGSTGIDPVETWKLRLLKAEILLWRSQYSQVLQVLRADAPTGLPPEFLARRKLAQARALIWFRQFDEARKTIKEAEDIARSECQEVLADVILAKGNLSRTQGMRSEAEQELEVARRLAHEQNGKIVESEALGTLSALYTSEGLYDKAIDRGFESLELSQALHARHIEAGVRLNIGWSYLELGDFEQAIPFFKVSEALSSAAGMAKIQQEALNSLGRIYFNQGNNQAADEYYKRALALAQTLHDEAATALYMDNLASVSLSLGRLDEADSYNQDALKMQREIQDRREELWSLSTAAGIADARKQFAKGASILDGLLSDKDAPTAVHWEACHQLANLYVQTGKRVQAQAEFKKGLGFLDQSWNAIGKDENKFSFSTWAKDFYTDYIRFLVAQHDPIGAMQVAESMRARTLEEALGKSTAKHPALPLIQNFLRTNRKIILAYWLAPEHSYLWVVTPTQAQAFILPSKQEIETRVEQYQHSVITLGDVERTNASGQELYQILIAPAQKMIPPGAQVVVIPDGSLGKLNFETLIAPQPSPHFWIDDAQIEAANSMALLVSSRSSRQRPRTLLAIGDPVEVTSDYPRLKYASQEIKAATEHFASNNPKVFSEAAATPSSYTQNAPGQYDLIHFATHGFASETRPLESAIILSPEKDKSFKLYGRDIVKIPLKADIVTISACYGAGKRTYSGEGLVGLAWAFLRAGAHHVIAGLWDVEDQPTPELMQNFYSELATGKSAALALHDAKLKMLHSKDVYRLPYYWAALQLYVGS